MGPGPAGRSRSARRPRRPRCSPSPSWQIPEAEQFRRNRQNFPLPPEAIARVGDAWLRHAGSPDRMAFSADGRFLATGAVGDRWLRVWDLTAGRPRAHLRLGPGEVPVAVALSPDGGTLRAVVRAGRRAHLREYDTFRALETTAGPLARPAAVAFDPAGDLAGPRPAGEVRLVDAATGVERWRADVCRGPSPSRSPSPATGWPSWGPGPTGSACSTLSDRHPGRRAGRGRGRR